MCWERSRDYFILNLSSSSNVSMYSHGTHCIVEGQAMGTQCLTSCPLGLQIWSQIQQTCVLCIPSGFFTNHRCYKLIIHPNFLGCFSFQTREALYVHIFVVVVVVTVVRFFGLCFVFTCQEHVPVSHMGVSRFLGVSVGLMFAYLLLSGCLYHCWKCWTSCWLMGALTSLLPRRSKYLLA